MKMNVAHYATIFDPFGRHKKAVYIPPPEKLFHSATALETPRKKRPKMAAAPKKGEYIRLVLLLIINPPLFF